MSLSHRRLRAEPRPMMLRQYHHEAAVPRGADLQLENPPSQQIAEPRGTMSLMGHEQASRACPSLGPLRPKSGRSYL